jgi:hypothetical protein
MAALAAARPILKVIITSSPQCGFYVTLVASVAEKP